MSPLFADGTMRRVGYAQDAPGSEELSSQMNALSAAGCERIFTDTVPARTAARPEFAAAVEFCRRHRTTDPHEVVILTVGEIRRLGRGALEFLDATRQLRAETIWLEILAGPMQGIHSPNPGDSALFETASALASLEHDHTTTLARERRTAARENGRQGGRPKLLDGGMAAVARELKDQGVPVPDIARRLVIPDGKKKGRHPSVATVYRLLATTQADDTSASIITSAPAESVNGNADTAGAAEPHNATAAAPEAIPTA